MNVRWKHIAVALAILPVVALAFAWIGFFNVGASTGHWKVTEWFLHFSMRSAVRTYALAVEVPDQLPRHAIQPAAAHFARGCAICHGAPGASRSPAVLRMLPQPPDLASAVDKWSDAELFRIVKHGVRFTGMPAWPTQARDDEVWAMVVFLRALPGMDPAAYRELAYGGPNAPTLNVADVREAIAECARCHGSDGGGRSTATPSLTGQNEAYLLESLRAYASGLRPSGVMALPLVATDPKILPALVKQLASGPPVEPTSTEVDPALLREGEAIVLDGIPSRNVPACLGCHAPDRRNPFYPKLAGQPAAFVESQLRLFRSETRGGTRYSHLMANVARNLSDSDIAAVAAYFSTLRQEAETEGP
jgi:cytochrome c553